MQNLKQKIKNYVNHVKTDPLSQGIFIGGAAAMIGFKLANVQVADKNALIVPASIIAEAALDGCSFVTLHGDKIVGITAANVTPK